MLINAKQIIDQAIKPNAHELSSIMVTKDIACVIFEPTTSMSATAIKLGWDGISPIFRMDPEVQVKLAGQVKTRDPVYYKWLMRVGYGRILVLVRDDALLLNHDIVNGFSVEEEDRPQSERFVN